MQKALGKTIKK